MSFLISMRQIDLEVIGVDGRATAGKAFLHTVAEHSSEPEKLLSHLNDPRISFVPISVAGEIELFNLAAVAYVKVEGKAPEVELFEEVGALKARVMMSFAGAPPLTGELLYEQPLGRARVSDLLNSQEERFLLLLTPQETCYVRREAILRARELPRTE